ncbi:MAG: hypothetical protein [Microviridae sp.]|nr:MAG: hypothetical protein [Microviridae sp.]
MKLTETIFASEWIDGHGWLYEDSVASLREVYFPFISHYDPEEFDWKDYEDYYSSQLPKGTDLYLTVLFSVDGCDVCSFSEWASVLRSYDDIDNDVCV